MAATSPEEASKVPREADQAEEHEVGLLGRRGQGGYQGETSGIKTGLIKSVKLS